MIDHGHLFRLKPRWIHAPPLRLKPHWITLTKELIIPAVFFVMNTPDEMANMRLDNKRAAL
jgi:hypothetical protein